MDSPPRHVPHPCLGTAAQEVRTFADLIFAGIADIHPNAQCPWHEDIPALVRAVQLGNGATERIVELGQRSTSLVLWSITDHIYALSNCVVDRTLFSISSLARIIVEAAAWAAWLNDDRLDARTILARTVKLEKKSLKAECARLGIAIERIGSGEMASRLDEMLTQHTSEMDEYAIVLNHLGVVRNSKVPKRKTEIVREFSTQANLPGLAQLSYGNHSSIVHSEPFMLRRSLNSGAEAHSDLQKSMTVQSKLTPVLEALRVASWLTKSVGHWWDHEIDVPVLDEIFDRVRSIGRQFKNDPCETSTE